MTNKKVATALSVAEMTKQAKIPREVAMGDKLSSLRYVPNLFTGTRSSKKTAWFFGDSLTYGYGVMPFQTWPEIICKHFGVACVNKAISGDTAARANRAKLIDKELFWYKPKYVFICYGTNDFATGRTPEQLIADLANMVMAVHKRGCTPCVVATPNYWKNGLPSTTAEDAPLYQQLQWIAAMNGIHLPVVYGALSGALAKPSNLMADKIHLTAQGYQEMANTMIPQLWMY